MRIRARIYAGFFLVVAVGFGALLYWIVEDLKPQFRKTTEEPLVDSSRMLASVAAVTSKDGKLDAGLFRDAFRDTYSHGFSASIYGFEKTFVDTRVYITDEHGIVVFDSAGKDTGRDYSDWNDVKRTLEGGYGARTTRSDPDDPDTSVLYVASPITVDGKIIGVLSVGKPAVNANMFVEAAKWKIVLIGLMVGLVTVFVGMLLSWRITAPIKSLTDYAHRVRDGGRAELPYLGGTEIRDLGEAFDEMRSALEGREYVERYIQTLTHEIKSPLSAIRGAAELLNEDVPPDQRARFRNNIREESDRISRVVDKLLLLASLEKLDHVRDLKPVDLSAVIAEVGESLFPVMEKRGVVMETGSPGHLWLMADPFLIRHAVTNLVQNAVDFSPEGGTIGVDAREDAGKVTLTVTDCGPGIPDYALARVFERFYSLKRPGNGRKSSGLGLCLVKEVAELHHGSVTLENSPGGGAVATLTLPAEQPS